MNATTIDATMIATIVSAVITALQGNDTAQNIAVSALPTKASKTREKAVTVNKGSEEKPRKISNVIFTAWRHSYDRTQKDGTAQTCKTVQISADRKVPKNEYKALLKDLQAIDKGVYYSKVSHAFVFQSPTKDTEKAIREKYGVIKAKMPKEHAEYIERRRALNEAKKA